MTGAVMLLVSRCWRAMNVLWIHHSAIRRAVVLSKEGTPL